MVRDGVLNVTLRKAETGIWGRIESDISLSKGKHKYQL